MTIRWAAALLALSVAMPASAQDGGLFAKTDRAQYAAAEVPADRALGEVTLINQRDEPVYLPGCNAFLIEQQSATGEWDLGVPHRECFWEGYAVRVDAGATWRGVFNLLGRDQTGTWRIRFDASLGCTDGEPLSAAGCTGKVTVFSPPFTSGP